MNRIEEHINDRDQASRSAAYQDTGRCSYCGHDKMHHGAFTYACTHPICKASPYPCSSYEPENR